MITPQIIIMIPSLSVLYSTVNVVNETIVIWLPPLMDLIRDISFADGFISMKERKKERKEERKKGRKEERKKGKNKECLVRTRGASKPRVV